MAVSVNVTTSLSERGDRVKEQLDTEFVIINDNENIPSDSGFYQFYLKNIGGASLITTEEIFQVFIDGDIVEKAYYNFSTTSLKIGEVSTLSISTSVISLGDHTLRVVGPLAIDEEFIFTI